MQARSANAIAALIDLCSSPNSPVKTNPSDKLIKNLCTFLCQDVSRTAIFAATKANKKGILTIEYNPARGVATKESKVADPEPEDLLAAKLVYRGAEIALGQLAERFGADLLQKVPKLWSCMSDALLTTYSSREFSSSAWNNTGLDQSDLLLCSRRCARGRYLGRRRSTRSRPSRLLDGFAHNRPTLAPRLAQSSLYFVPAAGARDSEQVFRCSLCYCTMLRCPV